MRISGTGKFTSLTKFRFSTGEFVRSARYQEHIEKIRDEIGFNNQCYIAGTFLRLNPMVLQLSEVESVQY